MLTKKYTFRTIQFFLLLFWTGYILTAREHTDYDSSGETKHINNRSQSLSKYYSNTSSDKLTEKTEEFIIYNSWNFEDKNIGKYPEAEIREDFNVAALYSVNSASILIDTINNIPTKVLKSTNAADELSSGFQMNVQLNIYQELYMSYNIKFDKDWNSTAGGKLPGLRGLPTGGYENCPDSPDDGFYLAPMFKYGNSMISYHYDRTPPVNRIGCVGWPTNTVCPWAIQEYYYNPIYFANGTWYNVTQRLVVNTFTNGIPNADGINEIWVDGKIIFRESELVLIEDPEKGIDGIFIGSYYGGSSDIYKPLYESPCYLDNIVLYTPVTDDVTGNQLHSASHILETPNEITDKRLYYDKKINTPGTLNNSAYPNKYGSCIDEAYLVDAGEENNITFKYDDNIGIGDYLFFYDGNTTDAPLLKVIAGGAIQTNQTVKSTGRYLFVRFSTDREDNAAGWNGIVTFTEVPAAPSNLKVTGSDASHVSFSWTDNSTDEYGFEIQRAVNNGSFVKLADVISNVTSFTDRNVVQNTEYTYRVRAYNNNGYSGFSNSINVFVSSATNPPAAPSNLNASYVSVNRVELEWTDMSDNESGFEIQKAVGDDVFAKVTDVNTDITSFTDYTVGENTEYAYRVRAFNSDGYSAFSNIIELVTPLKETPDAPKDLAASFVGSKQIDLEWIDMANNEFGFELYRADIYMIFDMISALDSNTMYYVDTLGIVPSAQYYYLLRAYNDHGYSLFTDTLEVFTQDGIKPEPPSQLGIAGINQSNISLNWKDNSVNESGFVIKRATYPSETYEIIHTTSPNSSTYLDEQIVPGATYFYKVSAINEAGESNYSNLVRISSQMLFDTLRIKDGLIAEYIFTFDSSEVILDRSGYNRPLDLLIQEPEKIELTSEGKLKILTDTRLCSQHEAVKISQACKKANEITVECWLKSRERQNQNLSKVLSIENNTSQAFALNVFSDMYSIEKIYYSTNLCTTTTDEFGNPSLIMNTNLDADVLQHIVYTHNLSGDEKIFVNGEELVSGFRPANYSKWENDYSLLIANNFNEDAPWLGDLYLLAVYNRSLSPEEIYTNYLASPFSNLDYVLNSHKYELHLFPNPANDIVTLTLTNPDGNTDITERYYIRILDIYGKVLYTEDVTSTINLDSVELNVSSLNSGVYLVVLYNRNEVITTQKLVLFD